MYSVYMYLRKHKNPYKIHKNIKYEETSKPDSKLDIII